MKLKIIFFMILIVLFTIVVTQNSQVIYVKALVWTFEMSAVVLIAVTGFIGLLLGFILAKIFDASSKKKKLEKEAEKLRKQQLKASEKKEVINEQTTGKIE